MLHQTLSYESQSPKRQAGSLVRFGSVYAVLYLWPKSANQVQVGNSIYDALVNVTLCRKVLWITSYVDRILRLVDSNVIHLHLRRERQMIQIHVAEIFRHAQVGDDILRSRIIRHCQGTKMPRTIGSWEMGRALISVWGSAAIPPMFNVQPIVLSAIQVMY
jgi:hypothetical protein